MDKKLKQHRHKNLTDDELSDIAAPRGASFDTEEGRAAQGMRPDIGSGESEEERKRDALPPPPAPPLPGRQSAEQSDDGDNESR